MEIWRWARSGVSFQSRYSLPIGDIPLFNSFVYLVLTSEKQAEVDHLPRPSVSLSSSVCRALGLCGASSEDAAAAGGGPWRPHSHAGGARKGSAGVGEHGLPGRAEGEAFAEGAPEEKSQGHRAAPRHSKASPSLLPVSPCGREHTLPHTGLRRRRGGDVRPGVERRPGFSVLPLLGLQLLLLLVVVPLPLILVLLLPCHYCYYHYCYC